MRIIRSRRGDVLVVRLDGDLDVASAEDFTLAAAGDAAGGEPRHLLVNFSRCTLLDSTGLGALLFCGREVRRRGGRVAVAAPSAAVFRVLQIGGFERLGRVYRQETDAVLALAGDTPPCD